MSREWKIKNDLRVFGYSENQAIFILACKKDNPLVDIGQFLLFDELFILNDELENRTVEQITLGMMEEIDYLRYVRHDLNGSQMKEIRKGLKSNVDVSIYEDAVYDEMQMRAIRKGLEAGIDVSSYAVLREDGEPKYSIDEMYRAYEKLLGALM